MALLSGGAARPVSLPEEPAAAEEEKGAEVPERAVDALKKQLAELQGAIASLTAAHAAAAASPPLPAPPAAPVAETAAEPLAAILSRIMQQPEGVPRPEDYDDEAAMAMACLNAQYGASADSKSRARKAATIALAGLYTSPVAPPRATVKRFQKMQLGLELRLFLPVGVGMILNESGEEVHASLQARAPARRIVSIEDFLNAFRNLKATMIALFTVWWDHPMDEYLRALQEVGTGFFTSTTFNVGLMVALDLTVRQEFHRLIVADPSTSVPSRSDGVRLAALAREPVLQHRANLLVPPPVQIMAAPVPQGVSSRAPTPTPRSDTRQGPAAPSRRLSADELAACRTNRLCIRFQTGSCRAATNGRVCEYAHTVVTEALVAEARSARESARKAREASY